MKLAHIVSCLVLSCSTAMASIENTRDWAAHRCFNSDVNSWLRPDNGWSEEVRKRQVKLVFFIYWLMYFGPDAYKDEEALQVRRFFDSKRKDTIKKLDFVNSPFPEMSGLHVLGKIDDRKVVSVDFDVGTEVLKLNTNGLTAGRLRSIIKDFEKWLKDGSDAK